MTETEMLEFEQTFERRLQAHAAIPVRPVDADAVARAVVASGRRRLVRGTAPWHRAVPRPLAWVAVALLVLAGILGGLVAGALLQRTSPLGGAPMVLAAEDGLFLGSADGRTRVLLRDDGMFLGPRWSPAGDRIAVLHGAAIPPQFRQGGAPVTTGAQFPLDALELLVLDEAGNTLFAVPGPIRDMAWGPAGSGGRELIAVGTTDGRVIVLDGAGAVLAEASRLVLEASVDQQALSPPGLAWTPAGDLLFTSGSRVLALQELGVPGVIAPAEPAVVLDAAGAARERHRAVARRVDARVCDRRLPHRVPGRGLDRGARTNGRRAARRGRPGGRPGRCPANDARRLGAGRRAAAPGRRSRRAAEPRGRSLTPVSSPSATPCRAGFAGLPTAPVPCWA